MSHQTGIQASDQLRTFFGKCKQGRARIIKVEIDKEQLVLNDFKEASLPWEDEYDKLVLPILEDKQPCYIFYRLDSQNESGHEWIFISWSPDNSPIREKMLYASTKATLKKEFGGGQIKHEMFGTQKEDVSLKAYYKHISTDKTPLPLTNAEAELQAIKRYELSADSKQTIQGVAFPVSSDAMNALYDMKSKRLNYVQLSIDVKKEEINLESTQETKIHSLHDRVPIDHARYHLFAFPHNYEGDYITSIVFVYSVPGYNCSVKERMLYSSCKSALLEVIEKKIGIELSKRIEIDDPKELTEEFIMDEIHPKKNIHKQKFAKPKGPGNRGAKRLIRPQQESV